MLPGGSFALLQHKHMAYSLLLVWQFCCVQDVTAGVGKIKLCIGQCFTSVPA